MAHSASLQVAPRANHGKGAARSLRRAGKIPGVIYGHNREPESLEVDAPHLSRTLTGISALTTVLDVTIGDRAPVKALIREIQRDPIKPANILHLDLYEVRADEAVTVEVPVHITGTAEGVRLYGGVMDQVLYTLEVECLPGEIPEHIELDVTHLGIGQSIHVSDVKLAAGTILNDAQLTVVTIVAPRTEEAAAGEGAAPAEPELIRKPKAEDGEE